ncbi:MAG: DEAD/DEAH box helicase [Methanoregula sp.]|jgi:ATP-dependent Lhr-like helicase
MSSAFTSLHESLQQVLAQRLDWTELREVQERAYTAIAAGKDVLVIAPTAGGKSEAALIPVMDDILKHGRMGVACLYISPLKALINDQEDRFREFCVPTSLTVIKWHGDVPKGDRGWKDGEPPHFLMITPESLEVLLQEKKHSADLQRVRTVIIDELHAFVESERGVQLKVLLNQLDRITKRPVQRVGLSATTGNPEEVLHWMSDDRHGSELVAIPAPPKDKQFRFIVEGGEEKRIDVLVDIVKGRKALVFVNSRSVAEKLMRSASGRIRNLHIHHSSLSLATRKESEEAFSSQDGACIICTSTLELGIDIGDLDVVVQVGPPNSVSSFLQRLGRSGRRDKAAYVAWLLKDPCELLCSVAIIECAMKKEVEPLTPLKKPYNVLVQQLFLYLFRYARASRRQLLTSVLSSPAFAGISPEMLDRIVTYLIERGYLTPDGEMVMLGETAEREFGHSNWKDLYSVIRGGGEYRAVTPDGEVVGKLDARFVNSQNDGEISLGGQGWSMVKCDEGHNLVVVVPSSSTTSGIFWTGGENGYSPLICRQVQVMRARGESVLPLTDDDQEILRTVFARIPEGVGSTGLYIRERKGESGVMVTVYSLNGIQFNRLLTLLLQKRLGSKAQVRYNDFVIRILRLGKEGAGERVATAVREAQGIGLKETGLFLPLPPYEGWKFARTLPEIPFREMAFSDYYHGEEFMDLFGEMTVTVLPGSPSEPIQEP